MQKQNDTTATLGWAFEQLHAMIAARIFHEISTTLLEGEFSFSQLNAMFHLLRYGPRTITQLADAARLSHAAASRMVDGLYRAGLVERREVAENRRQKHIELTPAGEEHLIKVRRVTAESYAALMENVPPELRARLADVLAEIGPYMPSHPMADVEPTPAGP